MEPCNPLRLLPQAQWFAKHKAAWHKPEVHRSAVPSAFESDTLIPDSLRRRLTSEVEAIKASVPREKWDWHRDHPGRLLLVSHPNQCFYIRGRSLLVSHGPNKEKKIDSGGAERRAGLDVGLQVEENLIESTPVPRNPISTCSVSNLE